MECRQRFCLVSTGSIIWSKYLVAILESQNVELGCEEKTRASGVREEKEKTDSRNIRSWERVVLASLRATWKPCKSIILSGTFSHRTEEKENTIDIGMNQSIMHGTTPVREQIDRVSQISNDSVPSLFNQFHSYSSRTIFSSPPASLIVFQIQDGTHPTFIKIRLVAKLRLHCRLIRIQLWDFINWTCTPLKSLYTL